MGNAVRIGVHGEIAVQAYRVKSFLWLHTYGAVLLDNGLLVTTAKDGAKNMHVVAIQTASPGLATSSWPTYCANNAHTCNDTIP